MSTSIDPAAELLRLINGYQVSQALHVAATLDIADKLKDGPKSYVDLAKACNAHPRSLYRLMRALASVGVFHEAHDKVFSLTPIGEKLTGDALGTRRNWARLIGRRGMWQTWGNLLHCVRTGEGAYPITHGMDSWSFRRANPEEQAAFDAAMTGNSLTQARVIADAFDFARFHQIVDVGGGQGHLLREILASHPGVKGVLFDQPQVVASAKSAIPLEGLQDRIEFASGSFFESVPDNGDAYLMKFILHDWADKEAVEILRTCRKAAPQSSMLLVIERVIGPPNAIPEEKFSDLNMLVAHGACERTREEFDELFQQGGFKLVDVVGTKSPLSILIAKPALS